VSQSENILLTRRTVIRLAAVVGAFPSGEWLFGFFANPSRDGLAKKIGEFYAHKEDAAIIGGEYLKSTVEEFNINKLTELICPTGSYKNKQLASANSNEAHDIIVGWQREDFEHGRIVNVAGWLLSETEARVCALTTLTIAASVKSNASPDRPPEF
jgi:hypothetical protein